MSDELNISSETILNVSIVIPVYNEAESLPFLHIKLHDALDDYAANWEVVYVDDGSRDGSLKILEELLDHDPDSTQVVSLRRNYGQTAAISAGIDHAAGDIIVLMDADLQNDPADVPELLDKIKEGYDLVSGWRRQRKDKFFTRTLPSRIANWMISKVTGVRLHDYGCTLKAYRREVITGFRLYGEMHRFIPVYASWVGAKIIEVDVRHHPRKFGKTNYGLERTIKVILDLFTVKFLTSYAAKPIYLFGGSGALFMSTGALGYLYLLYRKIFLAGAITTSPYFLASTLLLILGFQSILMGLLAELMVRTYYESQSKTIYSVRFRSTAPQISNFIEKENHLISPER